MENNYYLEIYDRIFFGLWDVTTGTATNKRKTYVGAKLYGQFLLSELNRYEKVKREGKHAIERHGLVAPMGLMKAWAFNILEDCHFGRVAPPYELCQAIYHLMGCNHLTPKRGKPEAKEAYSKLIARYPKIGVREAARRLGVNPSTILRWQNNNRNKIMPDLETEEEKYREDYPRIRKLTNVDEFYPIRWHVLREKSLAQHEQDVP